MLHRQYSDLPYVERDESWMYFNRRLIEEAKREDLPLLERLNFLGIYSSNLDEFFRVRIASLRRMAEDNPQVALEERKKARQILLRLGRLNAEYSTEYERTLLGLFEALGRQHIHVINEHDLTPDQEEEVRRYYTEHIGSSINPILLTPQTYLPEGQLKEALYLAVRLKPSLVAGEDEGGDMALIELPVDEVGRFVRLSDVGEDRYLMFLDDVVRYCLPFIFVGMPYTDFEAYTFKVTKDSEMDIEADLRSSVLDKVSRGIKRRKWGVPIRLVYDAQMPQEMLRAIGDLAGLGQMDVFRLGGGRYHDVKNLMKIPACDKEELHYPRWSPQVLPESHYRESLLERIQRKDIGMHFPYESFDGFLRVLREAAIHPDVEEIRITLYRVAKDSKVIKALLAAAQNGKRITAVVELLARFDEQSNIKWSKTLQDAGVKVVIGHELLKIHSKLVHITTKRGNIACISSGNMHEGTARLYTDYMLMTASPLISEDVRAVFDFIERPFIPQRFRSLLVAPNELRSNLYRLIQREIQNARIGRPAYIKVKINHIVDEGMVRKLYEAAEAGVEVMLAVRGNCSLLPRWEGCSKSIYITGIIDRYLEHSRICIFANAGVPEYYLGSSDWMPRNLDKRIEVMTPIYDPDIQQELEMIVDYALRDTAQSYFVNAEGGVPRRTRLAEGEVPFRSQEALYRYYQEQNG